MFFYNIHNKMAEFICESLFAESKVLRFSREADGARYVKKFDAWQYSVVMLYGVIFREWWAIESLHKQMRSLI